MIPFRSAIFARPTATRAALRAKVAAAILSGRCVARFFGSPPELIGVHPRGMGKWRERDRRTVLRRWMR